MVDLSKHLDNYPKEVKVYKKKILKRSGKYRDIHSPSEDLKKWLKTLLKYLVSTSPEFSHYIHSTKGKSCVTFAKSHLQSNNILVMDISNYFPSIKEEFALELINPFLGDKDLAKRVVEKCYYNGTLPQGFATSTFIANLASEFILSNLFKELEKESFISGMYVDDIAVSSRSEFDHEGICSKIKNELRKYGMDLNTKTKFYGKNDIKYITGLQLQADSNRVILSSETWEKLYGDIKSGQLSKVQAQGWHSYIGSFDRVKSRRLSRLISTQY